MELKSNSRKFPYWPFWLADGLLLCWTAIVWVSSYDSHGVAAISFYILSLALAFVFGVTPLFLEGWFARRKHERQQDREFRHSAALALGEILDRMEVLEGKTKSGGQVIDVEELRQIKQGVDECKETLNHLQAELKEEKKKTPRRGVSGILYPEHKAVSWTGKDKDVAETASGDLPPSEKAKEVVPAEEPETLVAEAANAYTVETSQEASDIPTGNVEVLVLALIGIGNKPYLRGNLPGLSPDQGVPLEFSEIGKWVWRGTNSAEPDAWVEVWLNDEIPAKQNPISVEGDRVEIRPVFQ